MKRCHLPPVLLLLLFFLSLSFRRCLLLSRNPYQSAVGDQHLHRLAAVGVSEDQLLSNVAALFANTSISTFPSIGNHDRLLYLCLPFHNPAAPGPPKQCAISHHRVPFVVIPSEASLLAAFCASLHSFLLARRRSHRGTVTAGVMTDLPVLLGRR